MSKKLSDAIAEYQAALAAQKTSYSNGLNPAGLNAAGQRIKDAISSVEEGADAFPQALSARTRLARASSFITGLLRGAPLLTRVPARSHRLAALPLRVGALAV